MEELIEKIRQWAIERELHKQSPKDQMCKLTEEVGELAKAINKHSDFGIVDGIGDVTVVLIVLCEQMHLDFKFCLKWAYNEIKERQGKIIDGTFVKNE